MLMLIITEAGVIVDSGNPSLFVEDEVFLSFLKNPERAIKFRNSYGKNLCVGRLGKKNDDGIYEEKQSIDSTNKLDDNIHGGVYYGYI